MRCIDPHAELTDEERKIRTRALDRGPGLTEVGFGAAQLGTLNRETTDEASTGAVRAAWTRGIRSFDTAPHDGIGVSESGLVGAAR